MMGSRKMVVRAISRHGGSGGRSGKGTAHLGSRAATRGTSGNSEYGETKALSFVRVVVLSFGQVVPNQIELSFG